MLRQNAGSNKRGLGLSRFSTSNFFTISNSANWGMGRSTKSNSLSSVSSNSDSYDNPIVDSDYIMQLSNDVRKFAEVLTSLKETFHSEGELPIFDMLMSAVSCVTAAYCTLRLFNDA